MKKIIFIGLILFSFSAFSLDVDLDFEREMCQTLMKEVPKQRGLSIWFDTPVGDWSNVTDWTSTFSSCHIDPETFDYDNVVIKVKVNNVYEPTGNVWRVPYHSKVDAEIRCLFSSNYEWECLYQNAATFDAQFLRIVLQQGTGITDSTWFRSYAPDVFLSKSKSIVNKWY